MYAPNIGNLYQFDKNLELESLIACMHNRFVRMHTMKKGTAQMGEIIKAICTCGFESENIFAGGGFQNFQTTCTAPAICLNCRKFLIKNYKKKHEKCPDCGKGVTFYNNPSLQIQTDESKKSRVIFSWHISGKRGDFQLPDTQYLCPRCGKMTLTFIVIGNWD